MTTDLEAGTYWVVMQVCPFEFKQTGPLRLPFPVVFHSEPAVGYLPIYRTQEDAASDYPNGPFKQIRVQIQVKETS